MDRCIADHRGRIANTAGDSVLAEFPSVIDAMRCAVAVQQELAQAATAVPLQFRIGVHVGDVVAKGADLLGDGVNIAARLQSLAEPGGICLSAAVHDQVRRALPVGFRDLGLQELKNIDEPIRAYAVALASEAPRLTKEASGPQALALPSKPSIAVLPFTNMSGEPEQEYFADGITEDIITALSRIAWFFVIARNSSFTYKGRAVDVRQVGRELGVRYVLEGSVRRAGNRVRITGQLIEAATGRHIWADRFDGDMADVFDLQDRVTESVVCAIEPSLQAAEIARARVKPTDSVDAYDLFLLGMAKFYAGTEPDLKAGQALMLRALAADKHFTLAKAMVARIIGYRLGKHPDSYADIPLGVRLCREVIAEAGDDAGALRIAGDMVAHLARIRSRSFGSAVRW